MPGLTKVEVPRVILRASFDKVTIELRTRTAGGYLVARHGRCGGSLMTFPPNSPHYAAGGGGPWDEALALYTGWVHEFIEPARIARIAFGAEVPAYSSFFERREP